jgi:predicted  nucleic acid-binding Zn-ribbon protein
MAYCNECGFRVPDLAKFCQGCGTSLPGTGKENKSDTQVHSIIETIDETEHSPERSLSFNVPKIGESTKCSKCFHFYRADLLRKCPECGTITFGFDQAYKELIATKYSNQGYEKKHRVLRVRTWIGVAVLGLIGYAIINSGQATNSPADSNPIVSDNTDTSNDSDGYWVSKCRWVRVPNPNYQGGSSTSVNENIANGPVYVSEQQCTDVFVSN